jgi:serine/threonine protein kinase
MSASTFGKYELVNKLASGGMAVAHKALMLGAKGVKKPVVLKLIHPHLAEQPEFVEMFIEEARLSATLTHSNIAQVFDFGEVEGRYFIAMELVDGQSLAQLLRRAQRRGHDTLPVPLALLIATEMCEALHYAHTRTDERGKPLNLVHRDVSPENVLISWQGEVKLVDFGIAKSTMTGKQTATGMVKGKYPYFSPEQSRADRTVDARTDIYAATVVLYEMLCARRPYEGEFQDVMRALLTGDYPLPSSLNPAVPLALEQLMLKGLALDRNARFRTARELGQQLGALSHSLYPEVQRSDLQSLMSLMFEEDLKALGQRAEIRPGFREQLERGFSASDTGSDKTPVVGGLALAEPSKRKAPGSKVSSLTPAKGKKPSGATKPGPSVIAPLDTRLAPPDPAETRLGPSDTQLEDSQEDAKALPPSVKMTGPQRPELSLDTPEKAAARARAVKAIAIGAGVVFILIAVLALLLKKEDPPPKLPKTPVWATSVPAGAEVTVDGNPAGRAPMDGMLVEGTYTFGMALPGYRPWTKRVTIVGPRQIHVEGQLVPENGDKPEEAEIPGEVRPPDGPITELAVDAGIVINADKKHVYHWPMRSFSVWPEYHTLPLSQYRMFSYDLEPDTVYQVSTNGSLDLGAHLGKTSAVMYYLDGEKLEPKDRSGYLTPTPKTIRKASKLYAWVFDDEPSDNKGRLSFTFRISKYIPERYASFKPEEHVVVPASTDTLTIDGLQPDHTYSLVFRPDSPRVMGAAPAGLFCIHDTPKPKPIQKRYVLYPLKFTGDLTGVTSITCMFLAWENHATGGVLEVDIDDLAESGKK